MKPIVTQRQNGVSGLATRRHGAEASYAISERFWAHLAACFLVAVRGRS